MGDVPIFLIFVADDAGRIVQLATLHRKHLWIAPLVVELFSIRTNASLKFQQVPTLR
jgi:hypothetical protein